MIDELLSAAWASARAGSVRRALALVAEAGDAMPADDPRRGALAAIEAEALLHRGGSRHTRLAEIEALSHTSSHAPTRAASLLIVARDAGTRGETARAHALFLAAREAWRAAGDPNGEASVLRHRAWAWRRDGAFDAAIALLDEAAEIADGQERCLCLATRGSVLRQVARLAEAETALQAALPEARGAVRAYVVGELGHLHQRLDSDETVALFREAIAAYRDADEAESAWSVLNSLGDALRLRGRWDEAEAAYGEASAANLASGRSDEIVEVNRSLLAVERGDWRAGRARLEALLVRAAFPSTRRAVRFLLLPCCAQAGDGEAWDEHWRALATETWDGCDPDFARAALRAAELWAPTDGSRATRSLALAVPQFERLGAERAPILAILPSLRGAPVPAGWFELHAPIGRGGMGEVWRGVDLRNGRSVAIKVLVDADARRPERLAAFAREARAAASLDHPAVVPVLGHGELGTTAELLSGGRLAAGSPFLVMALAEGGTLAEAAPLPWPAARRVLDRVLAGLAHAHARGLLHRDVKPANVLFADGDAQLADFGLAHGREEPGMPGVIAGTPAFMAPEQRVGGPLVPATDLYAVGRVARAIVGDHPVPTGLAGWIAALCAHDPRDRYAFAADARAGLDALGPPVAPLADAAPAGGETFVLDAPAAEPAAEAGPPAPLARAGVPEEAGDPGGLYGRADEQAALWRAFRAAAGGRPVLAQVVGAPGSGRTRLLAWIAERAEELAAARVIRLTEPAGRPRASDRPLVVLADDADDDPATARIAELLAGGGPVLVVVGRVTGPPEALHLRPLAPAAWRQLLREGLGLADDAAARLDALAAHNPRNAAEIARAWRDRGLLVPGPSGYTLARGAERSLPDTLVDPWALRLATAAAGWTSEVRRAVEIAAVEPAPFDPAAWAEVCTSAGVADPRAALPSLAAAGILVESGEALHFHHAGLRAAVLREAGERAAAWHAAWAAWLATRPDADPARRGRHRLGAGDPAGAADDLFAAARRARGAGRMADALAYLDAHDAALGPVAPGSDPRWLRAGLQRAWVLLEQGEVDTARDVARFLTERAEAHGWPTADLAWLRIDLLGHTGRLAEADALAASLGESPRAARQRGVIARLRGDYAAAERFLDEAIALHPPHERPGLLRHLALLRIGQGRFAEAEALVRESMQAKLSPALEAGAWRLLGDIARERGDLAACGAHLDRALAVHAAAGRDPTISDHVNRGLLELARGNEVAAEEALRTALRDALEAGHRGLELAIRAMLLPFDDDPAETVAALSRNLDLLIARDIAWVVERAAATQADPQVRASLSSLAGAIRARLP